MFWTTWCLQFAVCAGVGCADRAMRNLCDALTRTGATATTVLTLTLTLTVTTVVTAGIAALLTNTKNQECRV
jgi:hypothetical protein